MWGDADRPRPIRSNTRMNRPAISPAPPSRAMRLYLQAVIATGSVVLDPGRSGRRPDAASRRRGWRWPGWRCCPDGSGSVSRRSQPRSASTTRSSLPPRCCSGPRRRRSRSPPHSILYSLRRRRPMQQLAFNAAALALSMWASASAFFAIAGRRPAGDRSRADRAAGAAAAGADRRLLRAQLGLDRARRRPRLAVSRRFRSGARHFRWLWVGYLGAGVGRVLPHPAAAAARASRRRPWCCRCWRCSTSRCVRRSDGSTTRGAISAISTDCISRPSKRSRWRSTPRTT